MSRVLAPSIGGLHPGHARLTGAKPLRSLRLCQAELFATLPKAVGQRERHVDEAALFDRQPQEVAGITDGPARSFQRLARIGLHGDLLVVLG
jgi:hypothetical protein